MYIFFETPELLNEQEVIKKYPHSRYILKDINDVNNVKGYLIAVSTDRDSFKQICIKRDELLNDGMDVALLGSYGGTKIGVLNETN